MGIEQILQLISTYGIAIIGCVFFAKQNQNLSKDYKEEVKELNTIHREEIKMFTESLNNNTTAIELLSENLKEGKL